MLFWKDFEFYFYSLSKERVHLSFRDVRLIGIRSSECSLLMAKLYIYGIAEDLKYLQA